VALLTVDHDQPVRPQKGAEVYFLGESTHTIDDKFRLIIPKRFHAALQRDLEGNTVAMLTRGFEQCIFLFSEAGFEAVVTRLATQPFVDSEQRKIQRLFFSNTYRCELDKLGRIILPEKLRIHAGINKEVALLGIATRAEIWDLEAWKRFEFDSTNDFDNLAGQVLDPKEDQ